MAAEIAAVVAVVGVTVLTEFGRCLFQLSHSAAVVAVVGVTVLTEFGRCLFRLSHLIAKLGSERRSLGSFGTWVQAVIVLFEEQAKRGRRN
ncbi:hypothetical protein NL676_033184 [Syzygium grande]|nr:hypothetical protein NL676_033184 [Syzygium grande]